MDVVITYVDGRDPQWQKEYAQAAGGPIVAKRYRDWGLLKYLLRGIETNMPFVRNIYLVVSGQGQVPAWVSDKLKIVLHKDIIPQEYLPVFNSCSIELFLHRIPGLDREFIYFNDDLIPISPCSRESFFVDGRPAIKFSKCLFAGGMFKKQVKTSSDLARKALGLPASRIFVRPCHSCTPMLRDAGTEAFKAVEADLTSRVSMLRRPDNANQYFFSDYLYFSGRTAPRGFRTKHISLAVYSGKAVARFIANPTAEIVCINDVSMSEEKFKDTQARILEAFDSRLPRKSIYEQ